MSPCQTKEPIIRTKKWYWHIGRIDILIFFSLLALGYALYEFPRLEPEIEITPLYVAVVSIMVMGRLVAAFILPTLYRLFVRHSSGVLISVLTVIVSLVIAVFYDYFVLGMRTGGMYVVILAATVYKMMRSASALSIIPNWCFGTKARDSGHTPGK